MAKRILLPLAPDDAAVDAEFVVEAVDEARRAHASAESGPGASEGLTTARAAWIQRERILSLEEHFGGAREFLLLAMGHDHESYTMKEAAHALDLSRQVLHRNCLRWFGFPPSLVIDLRRADSVHREIITAPDSLKAIAASYRFPDLSTMGRFVLRFVGLRPARIRKTSAYGLYP
jgi:AraC-like DNA-binding protein